MLRFGMRTLLAATAIVGTFVVTPALAQNRGGNGGAAGNGDSPGGAGGSAQNATGVGTNGMPGNQDGNAPSGGGGGGAGGGTGGAGGGGANSFGAGGVGGTPGANGVAGVGSIGGTGGNGASEAGGGGGGGGGGHGGVVTTLPAGAGNFQGGQGGQGGNIGGGGLGGSAGGGGGGGEGGYGVVITNSATASTNSGTVTGGNGGNGGGTGSGPVGAEFGGNGGDGGIGLYATTSGVSITNVGSITGGNGGTGGVGNLGNGTAGTGGAGIVGSGIVIINSGSIAGGLGNAGAGARANAITFTGGTNFLDITAGSAITGNVVAFSTADTFTLTGATNSTFNASSIGPSAQYQGFGVFDKTGVSIWTLTGTPGQVTPWTVSDGTLAAGASTNVFGSTSAITVSAPGTLDLAGFSQTIGSLSGAGTVTNSSTTTAATLSTNALNNASTTFSGNITDSAVASGVPGTPSAGSLGLTKQGTGTLTLSGSNSYHGDTNISAGTLQAGSTGAFSANSNYIVASTTALDLNGFSNTVGSLGGAGGSVTNNGAANATLTAGGDNASTTFAGVIQDGSKTTGLTKAGTGTMTLSGANTYSGATMISAGTLALSASGSIASSSLVTVGTGGATATFDISATTGASVKGLAGASDGIVTLGNQTLTSTAGSSVNIFSGAINGNGGLTVTGGFQNLQGANAYTGVTTINSGGDLGVEGTGTIASSSKVVDNGALDLSVMSVNSSITSLAGTNAGAQVFLGNHSLTLTAANDTFAGVISGNGGLALTSGTETLTGTNAYLGATTINGGTLVINGSIATSSLTTVNTGALLTGIGTVGATTVASGGTFTPGNGTPGSSMTVSSLSLAGGAFYMVQLNPTTSSLAHVTGTATLGGATVDATFANGSYVSKQYTILTAGAVSGMFNPTVVNTNLPSAFHTTLSYDGSDAYLNLVLNFVPPGGGLNVNQQNVANAIVGFFNSNGSIPLVFGGLTPAGLTQISGETATGSQQTTFDAMNQFMGVLTDPFIDGRGDGVSAGGTAPTGYASTQKTGAARDANAMFTKAMPPVPSFDQRWSVWAAGYGGSQTTSGNATLGSNDATSRIYGAAVGADYRFSPFTIAGFALAGGGTSFSVANAGTGRSDLFQAGAFVRHTVGPAYITAALAYGWQDVTTNRTVTVAGTDMLQARFNANAWSGRLEGGYRYATPLTGITPYAAAQFTTFELPAYAEGVLSGANTFALSYAAKNVTDTRTELGIRTDKSWAMTDSIFTLRGRLAWAHDYDPDRSIGATFQTLPGASFVVNGAAQAHDSALTTASAEIKWINGWSAAATFEGEFSSVTNSYAGKGVVRYAW
jgi:autotransporter-associated beta strand protein